MHHFMTLLENIISGGNAPGPPPPPQDGASLERALRAPLVHNTDNALIKTPPLCFFLGKALYVFADNQRIYQNQIYWQTPSDNVLSVILLDSLSLLTLALLVSHGAFWSPPAAITSETKICSIQRWEKIWWFISKSVKKQYMFDIV